ncbi:MAG: VanZ family protein [Actinomycetota bacterium]
MTRVAESTPDAAADPFVRKSNRLWRVALFVAVAVQLIALYLPRAPAGPPVTGLDKVVHICIFAAPALAALMAGIRARWVLGILAVHAPLGELIQHFALPQRSGDVLDVMADSAGIALGSLAYLVWNRRQP